MGKNLSVSAVALTAPPTEGSPWQDGQDGQGVLTAIKNDGRKVFYDVVNIEPTKIKASDGTAEGNTSGSKSTETIGEAGESDAENADSNGKRHPTSPESIIQNTEAGVNDTAVENPGENVDYSDVETRIDPAELDGTGVEPGRAEADGPAAGGQCPDDHQGGAGRGGCHAGRDRSRDLCPGGEQPVPAGRGGT